MAEPIAHPPTTSHNFLAKLEVVLLVRADDARPVTRAHFEHDEWCDFAHGVGFCNCDPIITFPDDHVDN